MTQPIQLDYRTVTLPSEGHLYDGAIPEGAIQVRRMQGRELARLNEGGSVLDRVEGILRACSKLPENYPLSELLSTDRMYILLSIRTMTFGPVYTFDWRCKHCGSAEKHTVNIADDLDTKSGGVLVKETDERVLSEPFTAGPLPDLGKEVSLRFMRGRDEKSVIRHAKKVKMQGMDSQDPSELHRVTLQLVGVDGEDLPKHRQVQAVVDQLSARDVLALEHAINAAEPGVDLRVYPTCSNCNADSEIEMPFDMEFFRPSAVSAS